MTMLDQRASDDMPGLNLRRLTEWFSSAMPTTAGPLVSARLIAGGRSNLTFEVRGETGSWVLRRPPVGPVRSTAHDMEREYRFMSALAGTDVPVPATYAMCTDHSVLGAPFYVMEKVEGTPFRSAAQLSPLGRQRVRDISLRLVDALVTLHDVRPPDLPLADFGRPDGFLERQVRLWSAQMDASGCDVPAADRLRARLEASIPAAIAQTIVHGDYRLDNVLIDESDRAAAIIDWEMATIGDPLTDLALLIMYQKLSRLTDGHAISDAPTTPGYVTEDEIAHRYFSRSGRNPEGFGFYLGLAAYKLAAIVEGIRDRRRRGQAVGEGYERIGTLTVPLLEIGLVSMTEED